LSCIFVLNTLCDVWTSLFYAKEKMIRFTALLWVHISSIYSNLPWFFKVIRESFFIFSISNLISMHFDIFEIKSSCYFSNKHFDIYIPPYFAYKTNEITWIHLANQFEFLKIWYHNFTSPSRTFGFYFLFLNKEEILRLQCFFKTRNGY